MYASSSRFDHVFELSPREPRNLGITTINWHVTGLTVCVYRINMVENENRELPAFFCPNRRDFDRRRDILLILFSLLNVVGF